VRAFHIDAMHPKGTATYDSEDTKLSEAIYTAFPMETDGAVMTWGEAKIVLSYRYDIATIIEDLLEMVSALTASRKGQWQVDWPSNTFAGNWSLEWEGDILRVTTRWREEFYASQYLIDHSRLEVSKQAYLHDWGKVLKATLAGLLECGYSEENLADFEALPEAIGLIGT